MNQIEKSASKMASCSFHIPTSINPRHAPPPIHCYTAACTADRITSSFVSTTLNLHRSFTFKSNPRLSRCHATNPQSEPPSNKQPSSDMAATFTKFQDTLQIFFAVLFWMSLFFWSCAWDGGNNGKPQQGRIRK